MLAAILPGTIACKTLASTPPAFPHVCSCLQVGDNIPHSHTPAPDPQGIIHPLPPQKHKATSAGQHQPTSAIRLPSGYFLSTTGLQLLHPPPLCMARTCVHGRANKAHVYSNISCFPSERVFRLCAGSPAAWHKTPLSFPIRSVPAARFPSSLPPPYAGSLCTLLPAPGVGEGTHALYE